MILIHLILVNLINSQLISALNKPTSIEFTCDKKLICSSSNPSCPNGLTCKMGTSGINIGCCTKLSESTTAPDSQICGGFTNQQCPSGYDCKYGNTGSIGHCEPLPRCGGFANKQCDEGYACTYDNTGSDLGTCIKLVMCGGFAGAKCPEGYKCDYLKHADYGYCKQ